MQLTYLISVFATASLAFAQSCPNADGVSTSKYLGGCKGCVGPTSTAYAATFTATSSVDCAGCTSVELVPTGPVCLPACPQITTTLYVGDLTETTVVACSATPY